MGEEQAGVPGLGGPARARLSEMGGDGADRELLEDYLHGPQPRTTMGAGTKSHPCQKHAEKVKEEKTYGGGDDEYVQQGRGKGRGKMMGNERGGSRI